MQKTPHERRPLATPGDLAEYLGIPPHTLDDWRSRGIGPAWSKIGRHVRYRWADVELWVEQQQRQTERTA